MTTQIIVEVPLLEQEDLASLANSLPGSFLLDNRQLDGATVVQLVIPLGLASLATLRSWLLGRLSRNLTSTVKWHGNIIAGYTAEEVAEIVNALREEVEDETVE